jgi:hypothetical protein
MVIQPTILFVSFAFQHLKGNGMMTVITNKAHNTFSKGNGMTINYPIMIHMAHSTFSKGNCMTVMIHKSHTFIKGNCMAVMIHRAHNTYIKGNGMTILTHKVHFSSVPLEKLHKNGPFVDW